jgi:hypothetical protein
MKTLLNVAMTMVLLVSGHISPAMADGPKALGGNTLGGGSLVSDTTSRTATTPFPVGPQTGSNALQTRELDPELRRLYDESMQRAGVPFSERH